MYALDEGTRLGQFQVGEATAFNVGFVEEPVAQVDFLQVAGTLGSTVKAQITDATGSFDGDFLGDGVIDDTYESTTFFNRSLFNGEYVKIVDVTRGDLGFPVQFALVVPEPASAGMFIFGFLVVQSRRRIWLGGQHAR